MPKRFSPCHYVGNLTFLIWWHGNFHFKMKDIQLTKGYVALVDDEDFEAVNQFEWNVYISGKKIYAQRNIMNEYGKKSTQKMHRFIMGVTDPKIQVDHIFHDGLDNRKENLRLATNGQNQWNQRTPVNNTTGYKGVSFDKKLGKYRASRRSNNKLSLLGFFDSKEEAARHYNKEAFDNGDGFGMLNKVEPMFPTSERITREINNNKSSSETRERTLKYLSDVSNGLYNISHPGIIFSKRLGKWVARIPGKHIGCFINQSDAIAARNVAMKKSE